MGSERRQPMTKSKKKKVITPGQVIASLPTFTRDERIALIKALFAVEDTVLYTADDLQAMVEQQVEKRLNAKLATAKPPGPKVIRGIARLS
jgi:hypothetical protein